VTAVQKAVQTQWRRWGRPATLRVDNGVPWGNWNDLPTPFALWVLGAGVDLHWNDACCPQQNPKIERSQGTGKRWAEPGRCASVAQLQASLDEADRLQREEYPTAGGPSRLELFPELRHSGRAYTPSGEAREWSLQRVEAHLAGYVAIRKVSSTGRITVYDHDRYLGQQYRGQHVQVQYDPDGHQWLISDQSGRELRRHAAPEITREEIVKCNFRRKRQRPEAGR
jgi:hypothetical protein